VKRKKGKTWPAPTWPHQAHKGSSSKNSAEKNDRPQGGTKLASAPLFKDRVQHGEGSKVPWYKYGFNGRGKRSPSADEQREKGL